MLISVSGWCVSLVKSVYVMRGRDYSRLLNRFSKVVCLRCGKPLCVGGLVVSNSNGFYFRVYHKACFDKLYVDV